MESITVSRSMDAPPEAVREAMGDLGPFMRAAGFDEVDGDGDVIRLANRVGPATIQLELVLRETDHDLAYDQREGIFKEMRTTYDVEPSGEGSEVTATTEFALDVALVGEVLDSTIIKRQRRVELDAQFDWLETQTDDE